MFGHSRKGGSHKLGGLEWIALFLTIIGGINYAMVGAFNTDLVTFIFKDIGGFTRVVYVMIGIAAIYIAYLSPRLMRR